MLKMITTYVILNLDDNCDNADEYVKVIDRLN